jgi:superfamily II DNA or RNA helicase
MALVSGLRCLKLCAVTAAPALPQVDLIVCYDATASPTRSMQRMGRTGRHKDGRVVYLLAEGKEEEQYKQIEEVRYTGSTKSAVHRAPCRLAVLLVLATCSGLVPFACLRPRPCCR